MDVHRVYGALMRGFRRRRMARFVAQFDPGEDTRVLDVGGTDFNWRLCESRPRVTLLNLDHAAGDEGLPPRFTSVTAYGTELPHRDDAFDIAFSNSVIEHLGSYESHHRGPGGHHAIPGPDRRTSADGVAASDGPDHRLSLPLHLRDGGRGRAHAARPGCPQLPTRVPCPCSASWTLISSCSTPYSRNCSDIITDCS